MKTVFELVTANEKEVGPTGNTISIIGIEPLNKPYVVMEIRNYPNMFIKDKDLERFAVNILKALKSKKLK